MSAILLVSGLHFLFLGTAGGEQVTGWLVSGDDDLLVLSRVQDVEMLSPAQALVRVAA